MNAKRIKNKYAILVGDGMADLPIEELGFKTPLEYAATPNMDFLAQRGQIGRVLTIPDGFPPASDVANMSILGYDPRAYYTGRAPLEAINLGIKLKSNQIAFRLNFVTLSGSVSDACCVMHDFSAGNISSQESAALIETLKNELGNENLLLYAGVSYRNILLWQVENRGKEYVQQEIVKLLRLECTPPHDIQGKCVREYLPKGDLSENIVDLMRKAEKVLAKHPVNCARKSQGKEMANCFWLWGQGRTPNMPSFKQLFGLRGRIISAVDLINGIGRAIGLEPVRVEGATGYIDTNYKGKAAAAVKALEEGDFVFLHVEAPDEAAHHGSLNDKIKAIEDFDSQVVGEVLKAQRVDRCIRILVLCDHATPVSLRTHARGPVPFVMYPAVENNRTSLGYSEKNAAESGAVFDGDTFIKYFLS